MIISECLKNIFSLYKTTDINLNQMLTWSSDTRTYQDQDLFICLKGDHFDGFDYVDSICSPSLRIVLFEFKDRHQEKIKNLEQDYPQINFIGFENIIKSIQQLCLEQIKFFRLHGGKTFFVSGSNGKTTSKNMLGFLLSNWAPGEVVITAANNNNHIGVPFTVFSIDEKTRFLVIELGSNHPGEMEVLCKMTEPDNGIVTNIGQTHMEFFPTLQDVFQEESQLFQYIKKSKATNRFFIRNTEDPFLKNLLGDFPIIDISLSTQYYIDSPHWFGRHNQFNMNVAIQAAHYLTGESLESFLRIAKDFKPTKNRSELIRQNNKIIFLDAYNANPSSMDLAIKEYIIWLKDQGRSIEKTLFVLGDMNELGELSERYHQTIAKKCFDYGVMHCRFIGKFSKVYQDSFQGSSQIFEDVKSYHKIFRQADYPNFDNFFIKASRSIQLENLID